jgi:nitrate reductase assembly molybdenum cofactor insertion protein NarJ
MTAPGLDGAGRALALEAAEWRLLALLLGRPRRGWHEEVAALAAEVRDPELRGAAAGARDATEGEYHALLGLGGAASPREVGHRGAADPGRIHAEVRAHYEAFGFSPDGAEAADHVAVEADFLAYLKVKEAWALARGEEDRAAVAREAHGRFAREHLAPIARGLAARLGGLEGHVPIAARVLGARLAHLAVEWDGTAPDPLESGCPFAAECETSGSSDPA